MDEKPCTNLIENTATTAEQHPEVILARAIALGSSGSIEAMERRGSEQLVESDVLPSFGLVNFEQHEFLSGQRGWHEKVGIVVVGPVEGDPLFVFVTLPDGWKKELTDHDMWSRLIDDKGRVRANIFYKAASYDRRAYVAPSRRFTTDVVHVPKTNWNGPAVGIVLDCEKEIFRTHEFPPIRNPYNKNDEKPWPDDNGALDAALVWLNGCYPNHNDPCAYWDEP